MYTVKGNGNTIVWDGDNNRPLARFADGIFQTDDESAIDKLIAAGYEVEEKKRTSKDKNKDGESK